MDDAELEALRAEAATLRSKLSAAERTIDAMVRRFERRAGIDSEDQFAMVRAVASLQATVAARTIQLRDSEAHFRTLWDESPDALLIVNGQGELLESNRVARRKLCDDRLPATIMELFREPDVTIQGLLGPAGSPEDQELRLHNNRAVLVAVNRLPGGEVTRYLMGLRDVTTHRVMEAELAAIRRIAVVGGLAASVANEINNPLAVIMGRIELLSATPNPDAEVLISHTSVVTDQARRIESITAGLLSLARPGMGKREPIRLHGLLRNALRLCGRRLRMVRVEMDIQPPELEVLGDRVQLEQSFSALMTHSAEATRRRGVIQLRARAGGDQAVIELQDQARRGVPASLLKALSEPWSAMEGLPSGVTLGMVVAANTLREHGGLLKLTPDKARGSTYRVELPIPQTEGGESRKLLVVSGHQDLAAELKGMLEVDRHQVEHALSVGAALELLDANPYDLVLCAMSLSDHSALYLRSEVARRWPGREKRVAVVVELDHLDLPDVPTLRRPLNRRALLDCVQSVVTGFGATSAE